MCIRDSVGDDLLTLLRCLAMRNARRYNERTAGETLLTPSDSTMATSSQITTYSGVDHTWAFNAEDCAKQRISESVAAGNWRAAESAAYEASMFGLMANEAYSRIFQMPEEPAKGEDDCYESYYEKCAAVENARLAAVFRQLGIAFDEDKIQDNLAIHSKWFYRYLIPSDAGQFAAPCHYPLDAQFD